MIIINIDICYKFLTCPFFCPFVSFNFPIAEFLMEEQTIDNHFYHKKKILNQSENQNKQKDDFKKIFNLFSLVHPKVL